MAGLPKGVYDELLTASLRESICQLPPNLRAVVSTLSADDAIEYLARRIAERARHHLASTLVEGETQLTFNEANRILAGELDGDAVEPALLTAVCDSIARDPTVPKIPLSQSALVTNDQGLNYYSIIDSELASADNVDLICPFIGNQGLNLIIGLLADLGSRLRVITTTYLGGTNQRALERIAETGAQVKIVYERSDQKTRLHAKAWIFHRQSGFSTATIGSSNLSPRALVDGLEWNVRLSSKDAPQVLQELVVTFDRLWQDSLFEPFQPVRDSERLRNALKSQRGELNDAQFFADIRPLPHQQEALDEISYARLEARNRNLIVAATGTGKTLLAAFDYSRFAAAQGRRPTLLFVAHREDILKQSISAFRAVMRDGDFGELNVGPNRAESWRHVFASVQSLAHRTLSEIEPQHFDFIVIDEFHHAEAPTYLRLLEHFRPKQLLGLTATPERQDGKNVIDSFGVPTYELRLWHALDRNLLCPFHYYGLDDDTDLSGVTWAAGKYSDAELDRYFVACGDERAALIIRELLLKGPEPERLRAVAFCASIQHAEFMAEKFRSAGLSAQALHSGMARESRQESERRFRRGDLSIVCTVDLFNEGVDIPEINTVLFLRPTESATVFIQQLGRGLRNHSEKGALIVLDFVGQQNRNFRMDLRFREMTGLTRSHLEAAINSDFPALPPGCHIRLDRKTQERVLKNIREAIPSNLRAIVQELRRMNSAGIPITLTTFMQETGLELTDVYKGRSFNSLKRAAGLENVEVPETKKIRAYIHVDDHRRIGEYRRQLVREGKDVRCERMMAFGLRHSTSLEGLNDTVREEMLEVLTVLESHASHKPQVAQDLIFSLHSHYTRDEIVSCFDGNPEAMRQGTFYVKPLKLDVHLFTLRKSERDFSPTVRYADYFISPDVFHWESQSTTSVSSPTGQRLVCGEGRHLFFVRENRQEDGRPSPFLCLGFARPISSESEKPIRLVWKLEQVVPDHIYIKLRSAAG
jgi:superfamily II DNA or RNA helicase/HKD family nuclease